jgi:hypothetical protein
MKRFKPYQFIQTLWRPGLLIWFLHFPQMKTWSFEFLPDYLFADASQTQPEIKKTDVMDIIDQLNSEGKIGGLETEMAKQKLDTINPKDWNKISQTIRKVQRTIASEAEESVRPPFALPNQYRSENLSEKENVQVDQDLEFRNNIDDVKNIIKP